MPKTIHIIMHKDRQVAAIDETGLCKIFYKNFMPYSLYLEESEEIDDRIQNITNFNYWCASRVLTLDRTYAKEILNSIGVSQAVTDKERAQIALSYRCASLTDVFWVKLENEHITFREINLYDNHLENTFIDIALRGKQYSVQNEYLARDLSTSGCFPKAWQRTENGFRLLKDGDEDAVWRELLASQICRCFDVSQVLYEEEYFDGERVAVSNIMTSKDYSIVPMEAFIIYLQNHDKNIREAVLNLDKKNYYMMNIVDYLIGNTDRHWGNWGVYVDNSNNQPVCLHKLMDFNHAFHAYDSLDGANCQTAFRPTTPLQAAGHQAEDAAWQRGNGQEGQKNVTQRAAAIEAVKEIGINQKEEVKKDLFAHLPQYYDMFAARLELLKNIK